MNTSKRRIEQIKAKLGQLDQNISKSTKPDIVNLVDLLDDKVQRNRNKSSASQSQKTIDKNCIIPINLSNNRFYEEAKANTILKQRLEEEVDKGYKKIANKKKINDQSTQILSERLNTNIAIAILNADQDLTKNLKFEQIGKVLTDLQVFSIMTFDNEFKSKLIS